MDYPLEYNSFQKFEQIYDDYEFQDLYSFFGDKSILLNEKSENELDLLSIIKENFKYSSDVIINKKKSNPKSLKFESHCFFTPILKGNDPIINTNKTQKRNIYFISRKSMRKEMKDNIIKKIKSKFFKSIKKILKGKLLQKYKYKKSFKYLPPKFISDIKKINNKSIWEQTLLEFFTGKLECNNIVLKLLKSDKIGEISLKDIFCDYLNSQEFKDSIQSINNERNVDQNYIDDYIQNANNFIHYFTQEYKKTKN